MGLREDETRHAVNVAIQDLCAAAKAVENARRLELGLQLS
jgi:hypothetical protein